MWPACVDDIWHVQEEKLTFKGIMEVCALEILIIYLNKEHHIYYNRDCPYSCSQSSNSNYKQVGLKQLASTAPIREHTERDLYPACNADTTLSLSSSDWLNLFQGKQLPLPSRLMEELSPLPLDFFLTVLIVKSFPLFQWMVHLHTHHHIHAWWNCVLFMINLPLAIANSGPLKNPGVIFVYLTLDLVGHG